MSGMSTSTAPASSPRLPRLASASSAILPGLIAALAAASFLATCSAASFAAFSASDIPALSAAELASPSAASPSVSRLLASGIMKPASPATALAPRAAQSQPPKCPPDNSRMASRLLGPRAFFFLRRRRTHRPSRRRPSCSATRPHHRHCRCHRPPAHRSRCAWPP